MHYVAHNEHLQQRGDIDHVSPPFLAYGPQPARHRPASYEEGAQVPGALRGVLDGRCPRRRLGTVADVIAMTGGADGSRDDDTAVRPGCTAISPPPRSPHPRRPHASTVLPASALSFQALDHTRMNCDKSCVTDVSSWYGRRLLVRRRCGGGTDLRCRLRLLGHDAGYGYVLPRRSQRKMHRHRGRRCQGGL
jgi:hypothetical protein